LLAPRTGYRFGLAAAALIFGCSNLQHAAANGDTRTISLHHVHTKEDLTITYKRNGRYDPEAMKKLNHILRDWRRNEEVEQDPLLIDIVWEVQRTVGGNQPIHIICGYRAPSTNAMLRRRSSGVAQHSLHTHGKAMDFFIPGATVEQLRNIGLRLQRGGVGFYPSSGSPFVHLDVGRVRHWPGISRDELVKVFPDGRTVHIPSDGQPLAGYALAKADIERRGNQPSSVSVAAAEKAGVRTASASTNPALNPLARLLGIGQNQQPEPETTAAVASAPKPTVVAKPAPQPKPAEVKVASALPPKAPLIQQTTAGIPWPDLPSPLPMMPSQALAYAPLPGPEFNSRPAAPQRTVQARPLAPAVKPVAVAPVSTVPAYIPKETSIVVRQPDGPAIVHARRIQNGEPFDDPWLRAAILAPNLSHHMTAATMGAQDYRSLRVFMRKPTSLVTMAFSDDPTPGLLAHRFSGSAVVFVETTSFGARTALLQ
jgi:uncharacterized protein YcbK (DUF882 family)